ncbi:MAG: hypothetical protein ABJA60_09725, partial [Nitrosospira sp.]
RRFFWRVDGTVRFGLQTVPQPADEWAEITPISQEDQKHWAGDYLSSKSIVDSNAQNALSRTNWYAQFVASLETIDHATATNWNRFRSNKVSQIALTWCQTNNIALEKVFQSRTERGGKNTSPAEIGGSPTFVPDNAMRRVVLAALSKLPLERLLEIPIPAGLLLDAIAADTSSVNK